MKNAVKVAAALFIVTLLAAFGAYTYDQNRRAKAYEAMVDAMSVTIDPQYASVEYGSAFDPEKAVKKHSGTMEIFSDVDTSKVGKQKVTYRITDTDEYGVSAEKEFTFDIEVVDTTPADILLKEDRIAFSADMEFDPTLYVDEVVDPVEGALSFSEALTEGTYTMESNVDPETPGEYRILVTAMDAHGNESTAECAVTVLDKSAGKVYPYYMKINRKQCVVTVYSTDENGDPKTPLKAMVCSTGRATPLGSYRTYYRRRWNGLFGDVYGQYATGIVGDILFHSVPYYSTHLDDLEYEEYNKLGTAASMGCVRMCVRDVKWVYDYCSIGTVVEFYDDENDPGPLGKPEPITIDLEDPRRGWDPTDPDPDNPWNT